MSFVYGGFTVELLPTGARGVLAVVLDGGAVVHSDTAPTEIAAQEAARRWINAIATMEPTIPGVLVPPSAGTFAVGKLLAVGGAGWTLATNTDATLFAVGVVRSSSTAGARVVTSRGEVVRWPAHGLGSAGQRRWLGTAGASVSAEPGGASVKVVQVVFRVVDADHVLLFPESPVTF